VNALRAAGFEIVAAPDVRAAAEQHKADAGLEMQSGAGTTAVRIYSDQSEQIKFGVFRSRVNEVLNRMRDERISAELGRIGVRSDVANPWKLDHVNLAKPQRMMGSMFGGILSFMLLMFTLNGAMYAAVDITAGEKERRTMEILLSSAARREEIVFAKVFTAASICLTTALLSAASLMFGLRHVADDSRPGSPFASNMPMDPGTVALLLLSLVPLTVLVSSIAIALAAGARSTREGMSYAMPVLFIALGVGMSSFLPDFEAKQILDIVPFASFTRMIKQIMVGDWSWSRFGLALTANTAYALAAIAFAVHRFRDERVLLRT
jgi:sodium transport system permease protein